MCCLQRLSHFWNRMSGSERKLVIKGLHSLLLKAKQRYLNMQFSDRVWCSLQMVSLRSLPILCKGPRKRKNIVAETLLFPLVVSPFCADRKHLSRKHFLLPKNKKCFWLFSETFCFFKKCFPVLRGEKAMFSQHCFRNIVSLFAGAFSSCINKTHSLWRRKHVLTRIAIENI